MPPRDVTGPRKVHRKPAREPPPSGVFGPIGRADAPILKARRQAHERTRKARQPILKRTSVPYVPKLRQPTRQQRQAQVKIVGQGLKRQGVTTREVRALQRGEGSRRQQQAVNRYVAAARADIRKGLQQVGRTYTRPAPVGRIRDSIPEPGPGAPFALIDVLRPDRVNVRSRYMPTGRGEFERAGRQIASQVNVRAQAGRAPTRLGVGPATVNLTAASRAVSPYIAKAATFPVSLAKAGLELYDLERVFSEKNVFGRSANDLIQFPAAAIPTAYAAAKDPGRFVSDIGHQITHPGETFSQHPLFGALLVHGGVAAVGRGSGAIARSGVAGSAAKRAGSTVRAPLVLAGNQGTRLVQERGYSRSLIHKGAQVLADKRLAGAVHPDGTPMLVTRAGRRVQAKRPSRVAAFTSRGHLVNKRGDFLASRANSAERLAREEESTFATRLVPARGGTQRFRPAQPQGRMQVLKRSYYRPERDVVALAHQKVLRSPETFREDLLKERERLETVYKARKSEMEPAERQTNRRNARTIDRVLKDPRAMANSEEVFASARGTVHEANLLADEAVGRQILDPSAAERAKLFPYAQAHMGAKPVEHADGRVSLRAEDGTFLSDEQIRQHMRDPTTGPIVDPAEVGFLTHRPDLRGARAFHVQFRPGKRQNLDAYHRTGATFEKGAVASDYGAIVEHLVRTRNVLTNVKETDRLLNEAGVKHPEGRYFTWDEAEAYAKRSGRVGGEATNRKLSGEPDLVPVRAHPAKYDEARRADIQENLQNPTLPGASEKLMEQDWLERFKKSGDPKAQNVVLIPADLKAQLDKHLEPTKSAERGIQAATSAFRTTVLPFSTKWLFGNVAEAVGRLAIAGVAPHDSYVGRKVLKELIDIDKAAGDAFKASISGGLLFGERGLTNRRTLQDVTKTGGYAARLPVIRELGAVIKGYTGTVFALNRIMEREAQLAALGKHARRQMQEFTGSYTQALRAQRVAVREAAKGYRNTAAQHDAARFVDETLGQYSRFSPFVRHLVQTYTPFLPWYLNSVRFVYWTLPARHPVKTALLTQAEVAFQKDWEDQHKDVPPGDLKTTVPSKGGFVDLGRYTPFGFPGPVSMGATEDIASPLLPQISGAVAALQGNDPFGNPLKGPDGEVEGLARLPVAANQALGGFVPLVGLGQRIREGGGKPYATSNIFSPKTQPEGEHPVGAANRILNPFRPVYVSSSRQKKSKDPLVTKYGLKSGRSVDELSKKYGLDKGSDVDELAKKYGLK